MSKQLNQPTCEICGEPMPHGEQMFKFHGYSGPCPKPPLIRESQRTYALTPEQVERARTIINVDIDEPRGPVLLDAIELLREVVGDA